VRENSAAASGNMIEFRPSSFLLLPNAFEKHLSDTAHFRRTQPDISAT
jgi:hypothetical protein